MRMTRRDSGSNALATGRQCVGDGATVRPGLAPARHRAWLPRASCYDGWWDAPHGEPETRRKPSLAPDDYSAAVLTFATTGVTRAAQNLNSGIMPKGSSAGFVNRLIAASA